MNAWVLLLRGINVGGNNVLPMAELRALLATLGARNISTYIQSGNAVFTGLIDSRGFGALLEDEIQSQMGFRPQALVLSRESFTEILDAYPWPEAKDDPKSGHIWFLTDKPSAPDLKTLGKFASARERFELRDDVFYLHAPDGIGRSKLAEKVERLLGVSATARNLNTSMKVAALLDAFDEL